MQKVFSESRESSIFIPCYKGNFNQAIDFLVSEYPDLTRYKIADLLDISPSTLSRLLSGKAKRIRKSTAKKFMDLHVDIESGKIDLGSFDSTIPLDNDFLRQYVVFLQSEFPGITQSKIAEIAWVSSGRFTVFMLGSLKRIHIFEAEAIMSVYDKVKSGEVTYIPARKGPKTKRKNVKKMMPLDIDFLQRYIKFLKEISLGLSDRRINFLAGLPDGRLSSFLAGRQKKIKARDAEAIMSVYDKVKSGEMHYVTYKEGLVLDYRCKLQQVIRLVKEKYPEVSLSEITESLGLSDSEMGDLLN